MEEIKAFLKHSRTDYDLDKLDKDSIHPDPVLQFAMWMQQAIDGNVPEVNAMNLATASAEGKPSSRIVLLRNFDHEGFVFFSNYNSDKGRDLKENRYAALNFFWPGLDKQIRIEGSVAKVEDWYSDDYFNSRPRESKIGAWASEQSSVIKSRSELEQKVENLTTQFKDKDIPRPPHWGGYKLIPDMFEFWQGRPSRLHDRIRYTHSAGSSWHIERLSP